MARELTLAAPRMPMPREIVGDLTVGNWRVLCDVIYPNAKSPQSIVLALDYCKARRLDIMKRPVHIVPMWSSAANNGKGGMVDTIWPGINEVQVTAARTGEYAGMDPPHWGPDVTHMFRGVKKRGRDDQGEPYEIELTFPEYCSVTVYRLVQGQRVPFTEEVFWLETYATESRWSDVPNAMWLKRPRGQLHKCAKAASLRAAFPEELGNEYVAEEMEGKPLQPTHRDRVAELKVVNEDHEPEAAHDEPAPAEHIEPEIADVKQIYEIRDETGEVWNTTSSAKEIAIYYAEQKKAAKDKIAVAVQNLDALRALRDSGAVKNGNLDRLNAEIEAAEAVMEPAE